MKKILLLLFFALCFLFAKTQNYPLTQNIGSASTVVQVPANGALKGVVILRIFTDTATANLTYADANPAAMIFTSNDQIFWVRNSSATKWLPWANSGGSINIYNSDGTLTGERVLHIDNYSLTFTSTGGSGFFANNAGITTIGDVNGNNNTTILNIDDNNRLGYFRPTQGGATCFFGIGTDVPTELLTLGKTNTQTGVMGLVGLTSGKVIIQPKDIAGTWTMTLPNSGGSSGQFLRTDGTGITSWVSGSSGTVTSVSGTTNRITVATGTTTPVIDISAAYIGQTSLTTLGTVGTGLWQGTSIGAIYGGTGLNTGSSTGVPSISSGTWSVNSLLPVSLGGTGSASLTANNVLLGNGTSALQVVAPGTSGNVLTSNGTTWQSSTPAAGITGSGTTNKMTKWTSSSAIGNSSTSDDGTNVIFTEPVGFNNSTPIGTYKIYLPDAGTVLNQALLGGVICGSDGNGAKISMSGALTITKGNSCIYLDNIVGGGVLVSGDAVIAPVSSSLFSVNSTTKGFLPPRWTNAQMAAVSSPATGLIGYNTDALAAYAYNGSGYKSVGVVSGSYSSGAVVGQTVFTITFGGTQPNSTYKVDVVPTSVLGAALFYVTNKTTTTFDVTYLAGLTGTVLLDYAIFQ